MREFVRFGVCVLCLTFGGLACSPQTARHIVKNHSNQQKQDAVSRKLVPVPMYTEEQPFAPFRGVQSELPNGMAGAHLVRITRKQPPPLKRPIPVPSASRVPPAPRSTPVSTLKRVAMLSPSPSKRMARLLPPEPQPKPRPHPKYTRIPGIKQVAKSFLALGKRIVRSGNYIRWRHHKLIKRCRNASASKPGCRIFKRSAAIFAVNYKTSPRNYRGYMLFHSKNKKNIPKRLVEWYRNISNIRYKHDPPNGRCFLDRGLLSNCMSFAMCSQKAGFRNFRGVSGKEKGYHFPLWGYVNYWTTETYDKFLKDYRTSKHSPKRPGIRSLLASYPTMPYAKKKQRATQLLNDMLAFYLKRVKRSRIVRKHLMPFFEKAFCTNIVVSAGDFSPALPGDMFVLAFPRKRSRKGTKVTSYRFQHWGLITNPETGSILHNQTPGGVWGTSYHRWGIQGGTYEPEFTKRRGWKYNRARRFYEQRIVFVNRLNLHFFSFARKHNAPIYSADAPGLCRKWIKEHGAIYFADLNAALSD